MTSGTLSKDNRLYLQKSRQGGFLLLEVGVSEAPFFHVSLHSLEEKRLKVAANVFESDFEDEEDAYLEPLVDECDRFKFTLHLHSFAYDFHLRVVHSYVAGSNYSHLQKGYNVCQFLSDFIKYYSKGPSFARNMVREGVVEFKPRPDNDVTPNKLYDFLTRKNQDYNLQVMRMEPLFYSPGEDSFKVI